MEKQEPPHLYNVGDSVWVKVPDNVSPTSPACSKDPSSTCKPGQLSSNSTLIRKAPTIPTTTTTNMSSTMNDLWKEQGLSELEAHIKYVAENNSLKAAIKKERLDEEQRELSLPSRKLLEMDPYWSGSMQTMPPTPPKVPDVDKSDSPPLIVHDSSLVPKQNSPQEVITLNSQGDRVRSPIFKRKTLSSPSPPCLPLQPPSIFDNSFTQNTAIEFEVDGDFKVCPFLKIFLSKTI